MSLTEEQSKLLDTISKELEDSKAAYEDRERLGLGHTKYVVLNTNCLKITTDSLWAGESYDKEEARRIFFEVWGTSNGIPRVHPSGNHYVYPSKYENEILDWLAEEDDSLHWSGTLQKGRHSRV